MHWKRKNTNRFFWFCRRHRVALGLLQEYLYLLQYPLIWDLCLFNINMSEQSRVRKSYEHRLSLYNAQTRRQCWLCVAECLSVTFESIARFPLIRLSLCIQIMLISGTLFPIYRIFKLKSRFFFYNHQILSCLLVELL